MLFRRSFLYIILINISTVLLHAEWGSITLQEHLKRSDLIVIASFEKEISRRDSEMGTSQMVSFEVNEAIKGDVNGFITVKGQSLELCMPQKLFEIVPQTQYLLFLEQEDNSTSYNLVHGERSALIIKGGFVGWILDRKVIDKGEDILTSIENVKKEIQGLIK